MVPEPVATDELLDRADVVGSTIVEMAVYCTGDWDEAKQREHAAAVHLLRP